MSRKLCILAGFVAVLAFYSLAYAGDFQQNLIFNYDLNAGDVVTNFAAAWEPLDESLVESKVVTWDGEVGHSLPASIKVASRDAIETSVKYMETVPVTEGDTLKFSIWLKTELVEGDGAYAKIIYVNDSGTVVGEKATECLSGTSPWKEFKLEDKVPSGATGVIVTLGFKGSGIAWYDDVSLVTITSGE